MKRVLTTEIKLPKDFPWRRILSLYVRSRCLEATEYIDFETETLSGIVNLNQAFWYTAKAKPSRLTLTLKAQDGAKPPSNQDLEKLKAWAIHRFWLDIDMDDLRATLEQNFFGYSLSQRFWPLVSPTYTNFWSGYVRAVCGRENDLVFRQTCGDSTVFGGKSYPLLPTAEQVLQTPQAVLKEIGLSDWMRKSVHKLSEIYLSQGKVWPDEIPLEGSAAMTYFKKNSGLGTGNATWVLMRGVRNPDISLESTFVKRTLFEGLGKPFEPKEYQAEMKAFSPYRTFVSYYVYLDAVSRWRKDEV